MGIAILILIFASCGTFYDRLDDFLNFLTFGPSETTASTPAKGDPPSGSRISGNEKPGGGSSNNTVSSGSTSGGSTINTRTSSPAPSRNYVIPASYETAYSYRTDKPEQNMRNIPQNIETNRINNPSEYVRLAAGIINSSSKNDFERVKRAHDLVALLIKYDAPNFWANTVPNQSYENVLKTKLAVCEGYSNLFKRFCDELKIPCEIVHGFGRGVGSSPFAGDTPRNSNHAWNIVTIEGESYLIDCTWDSGYMDGRVSKQEYTTDWLFLKPEQFLCTHYPENQRQQLTAKPLSEAEFIRLPFYNPKYFEIVSEMSPVLTNINQVDGKLSFEYSLNDGYEISFDIYDENGGRQFPNNAFSQKEGDIYKAYFSFPNSGKYLLRMFWTRTGSRTGKSCAELGIISTSASQVTYPTQYSSSGKNIQIDPIEMPLHKGDKYTFQVQVDNKNTVALSYGRTFVQLKKDEDGVFRAEFEIPNNISELTINIADTERGRYETIAKYTVK
jgi:hypothetical protein